MKRRIAVLLLGAVIVAGCTQRSPTTTVVSSAPHVTAITSLDDQLLVATSESTQLQHIPAVTPSKHATHAPEPFGRPLFDREMSGTVTAMTTSANRVFAVVSTTDSGAGTNLSQVGEIRDNTFHVSWSTTDRVTAIAATPQSRLALAIQSAHKVFVVTIDPSANTEQLPNEIASGWSDPITAMTYGPDQQLWIVTSGNDPVVEKVTNGKPSTRQTRGITRNGTLSGLVWYGDQELLTCDTAQGKLHRLFIADGMHAVKGRILGDHCSGAPVVRERHVWYPATDGIRMS